MDHPVIVKIIGTVDFQLKAIEMIPCVLWCVCRYWKEPENCLIKAVGFGGDTDTRTTNKTNKQTVCVCLY